MLSTITYAISFDQAVTNVVASDFQVVTSGNAQATTPVVVSGSGSAYDVTIDGVHGNGTLQLDLINNGSIVNGSSQPLGSSFVGQIYTIDQAFPYVVSINRTTPSTSTTSADSVVFTVTFSEAVTGVVSGDFSVPTTGTVASTSTSVSGSGAVYSMTITGITGSGSLGLNLVDNGSIKDLAGNPLVQQKRAGVVPVPRGLSQGGSSPDAIAAADVNGDGKQDLVVANLFPNTRVSVLLGKRRRQLPGPADLRGRIGPICGGSGRFERRRQTRHSRR